MGFRIAISSLIGSAFTTFLVKRRDHFLFRFYKFHQHIPIRLTPFLSPRMPYYGSPPRRYVLTRARGPHYPLTPIFPPPAHFPGGNCPDAHHPSFIQAAPYLTFPTIFYMFFTYLRLPIVYSTWSSLLFSHLLSVPGGLISFILLFLFLAPKLPQSVLLLRAHSDRFSPSYVKPMFFLRSTSHPPELTTFYRVYLYFRFYSLAQANQTA